MDDNFGKWLELATDLAEKSIKNYLCAIRKINLDLSVYISKILLVVNPSILVQTF